MASGSVTEVNTILEQAMRKGVEAKYQAVVNARAEAKLTPLNISGQLSAAAQSHSDDMACNNFVGHSGSDGSSEKKGQGRRELEATGKRQRQAVELRSAAGPR